MTISETSPRFIAAEHVVVRDEMLTVRLSDGRTVSVPVAWFPRLLHGTDAERSNWSLIGGGNGIHWPGLDEDISVGSLLAGRRSGENQRSIKRWLASRGVYKYQKEKSKIQ